MILSFKTQIKGKPTYFEAKILALKIPFYKRQYKPKIHSIRKGKRWRAGMTIHMATGARTRYYQRFNGKGTLDECISVQDILIFPLTKEIKILDDNGVYQSLTEAQKVELSENDGFDTITDFWAFFEEDVNGQIIHWTDFKY